MEYTTKHTTIKVPIYEWYWQFTEETRWFVEKGNEPCALHRFMQRIILGIKWGKI